MTNLPPPDTPAVFWIDAAGQQQGPEPLATVIERVVAEQIPPSTPVWWQGAVNWAPFSSNEQLVSAVEARRTPPPPVAAAPTTSPFAPAAEPAAPMAFQSPATLEVPAAAPAAFAPAAFDAPVSNGASTSYDAAEAYEAPVTYEPAATHDAPASFEAPVTFEPAATYEPAAAYEAPVVYDPAPAADLPSAVAATTAVPVVEVPDAAYSAGFDAPAAPVILPEPEPAPVVLPEPEPVGPSLALGDPEQLRSTFTDLTARSAAFAEEEGRAAGLDEQFASMVAAAVTDIGFVIDERQSSGEYHSFRLTAPDGSVASLAVERLPSGSSVAAVVERPVMCFVDRGGRASARLFVGDYVANGGQDVDLLRGHLASIVDAAGA